MSELRYKLIAFASFLYSIVILIVINNDLLCVEDLSEFTLYKGPIYSKKGVTKIKQVLFETDTIGLSYHTVQFDKESPIINEWMYIDVPKEIVIVYMLSITFESNEDSINAFVLFNETSYSFAGSSLVAIHGTIDFNKNETSTEAVDRLIAPQLTVLDSLVEKNMEHKLIHFAEFLLNVNRCRFEQHILLRNRTQFRSIRSELVTHEWHIVDCNELHRLLLHSNGQNEIIPVKHSNALTWSWFLKCSH